MRKLLYLVPLVLIGLSFTPSASFQDTVSYSSDSTALTPSHWKSLEKYPSNSDNAKESGGINILLLEPEVISEDASFKGFPFGAYFTRPETGLKKDLIYGAYSWLWITVDALIVVAVTALSIKVNRKKKS